MRARGEAAAAVIPCAESRELPLLLSWLGPGADLSCAAHRNTRAAHVLLSEAAALIDSDKCEPTPAALPLRARADVSRVRRYNEALDKANQALVRAPVPSPVPFCAPFLFLYISLGARARACVRA